MTEFWYSSTPNNEEHNYKEYDTDFHYLILNFIIYINYVFTEKGKEMARVKKINTGRQKRASGSYSVELLIVVDYAIYQR